MPVPVRLDVCGLLLALSLTLSCPVLAPVWVGLNVTFVQADVVDLSCLSDETFIVKLPSWGAGSDHRPIVATFVAEER